MKTKKTNQESTNSTQKNVEQKSYNWQNGASSSIGAAIGVAAGSMAQTALQQSQSPKDRYSLPTLIPLQ